MATECTQETVLHFLTERGGRVKNSELIEHFRPIMRRDPGKKAIVKEALKRYVDNVASVKTENGEKYVCLKKKFRGPAKSSENGNDSACREHASLGNMSTMDQGDRNVSKDSEGPGILSQSNESCEYESNTKSAPQISFTASTDGRAQRDGCLETTENDEAKQEILLGSGYGTDSAEGVEPQPDITKSILDGVTANSGSIQPESRYCQSEMGQASSCTAPNRTLNGSEESLQIRKPQPKGEGVPQIAVIDASPSPIEADGAVFNLPQPGCSQRSGRAVVEGNGEPRNKTDENTKSFQDDIGIGRGYQHLKRRKPGGSQRSLQSSTDGPDEVQFDSASMSGSDSNTPRGSRKNFIELMMNSSPQVRRSMVFRNSIYLSTAKCPSGKGDSDSISIGSSNPDDENSQVALDPLEHEWMMCASDGEWESLHRLLAKEPNLIMKKDFVTGFTCLHWAAKMGKQELIAHLMTFAKEHGVDINVNARSSAGYTALHLAAMHNHAEVVKLLVGAYNADGEVRDYSGKKAHQYLKGRAGKDILELAGASCDSDTENVNCGERSRWRFSNVLQPNLKPLKVLNHSVSDEDVRGKASFMRSKPLRSKSSVGKVKPRLHKLRFKTQLVHSTSLFDRFDKDGGSGSVAPKRQAKSRSRPLSSLFG
ncbi:ankyrin repeat domain-containing protein SOWAHC-like [Chanos chanos]|uniref:Ankyrin repeat domain-containing protein SOWAHC-like n=1 Tax=Chanos chanos TaxID=29144 RepID=A0A6J2V7Z9_CHACN|nr:ankyrin repeat domain-containing protein SOWAHC-like [Chanos chanos]